MVLCTGKASGRTEICIVRPRPPTLLSVRPAVTKALAIYISYLVDMVDPLGIEPRTDGLRVRQRLIVVGCQRSPTMD